MTPALATGELLHNNNVGVSASTARTSLLKAEACLVSTTQENDRDGSICTLWRVRTNNEDERELRMRMIFGKL